MTLIRPIILYMERTALKKTEEVRLENFVGRKILKRIYGPIRDPQTEERRMRYNENLQNLFQRPCIKLSS